MHKVIPPALPCLVAGTPAFSGQGKGFVTIRPTDARARRRKAGPSKARY